MSSENLNVVPKPDIQTITCESRTKSNETIDLKSNEETRLSRPLSSLARLPTSSYSILMPYQLPQVGQVFKEILPDSKDLKIVDATVHIGGDSLHFAELYPTSKILAIDIDPNAISCLKQNIQKHNPASFDRFEIVQADCVSYISINKPKADLFYFDPPWGGPDYLEKKEMDLQLSGKDISFIVNMVFDLDLSLKVVLKIPKNFAYPKFKDMVKGDTQLYIIRKPKKNGSIAYGLVYITKRLDSTNISKIEKSL